MKKLALIVLALSIITSSFAQEPKKDKGKFIEFKPGYYQNYILKGIDEYEGQELKPKPTVTFKVDVTRMDIPTSVDQFKKYWAGEPVSQGNTGTCWCFSTTSYFESEIFRITGQKVKLSEMYTVYWEYIEKAKRFVQEKGNSAFAEGSEGNGVTRIWKLYGAVPIDAYSGLKSGQTYHNHAKMFEEMDTFLKSVKLSSLWNEEYVISTIKSIMNSYIGAPPTKVTVNGKEMTPQDYLKNILKINLDDYIDVMSLMQSPYYTRAEYNVTDNWWHCADYHNLPLDDYMKVVKNSIRNGYTIAIGGDVSEAGFIAFSQVALIPSFDIPSNFIDENARQLRFSNGTTTDDHGLHLMGWLEKDEKDWYLFKDSGSGSRNCGKESKNFGYYFVSEDYVKLKMMDFMVHKDMMKDYLPKFK